MTKGRRSINTGQMSELYILFCSETYATDFAFADSLGAIMPFYVLYMRDDFGHGDMLFTLLYTIFVRLAVWHSHDQ